MSVVPAPAVLNDVRTRNRRRSDRNERITRAALDHGSHTRRHGDDRGRCARRVAAAGIPTCTSPAISAAARCGTSRIAAFVPQSAPKRMTVIGAANGTMTLAACLTAGYRGRRTCGGRDRLQRTARTIGRKPMTNRSRSTPLWHVGGTKQKAFVDLQNDVTADDVALAEREGFRSVEHLKRYTTLGMATDQGRTANVNGIAIMAALTGRSIAATGTTTFRPPYTPVAIGAFAGHHRGKHFRPARLTPTQAWAQAAGRGVRGNRTVAARAVLSARRRARVARDGRPRGEHCARCGRLLRRVDARQDRCAGRGRRRVPGSSLRQHVLHLAGRTRALRRHAARGRFRARRRHDVAPRRRSLLHDDDDRQCGARVPAHAVLSPGAVAGARRATRLGDRPVGAVLGRGPEEPATHWRRWSTRRSISATPPSRISASPSSRSATASRRGSTTSPIRASLPTSWACRRATAKRWRTRLDGSRRALRHRAVRHRGARRDEDREGARGRQRNRRTHHGARSRARPHDVAEEGLCRARAGGAPGAARCGPAALRRLQADRSKRAPARRRASRTARRRR